MMRTRTRIPHLRPLAAVATLGLAAAIGGFAASSTPSPAPPEPTPTPAKATKPLDRFPAPSSTWKEVDRLQEEQKMQAALELAAKLREAAQQRGDGPEWARGLIRETQLRMALHGYETAVRHLRETPWPDDPLPDALLDLFYAESLVNYLRAYGYEIGRREEVVSTAVVDLKQWTREQLYLEAQKAFLDAWRRRAEWGDTPVAGVAEFITANDYPPGIRNTLRDATSYLFAELLADSSQWEPAQSNELYRLPLDQLIAGDQGPQGVETTVAGAAVHPLAKLAAVLGDLEGWHRAAPRPEAAFEARRQRLSHLHDHLTLAADRAKLRAALELALAGLGDSRAWWSRGVATLAEWVRGEDDPQALVRAREIARRGAAKHPSSVGGKLCARIVAEIEAPEYSLAAMASDAPGKRSLLINHRNLPRLWLRAYAVDLDARLATSRDYNLLPAWQEVETLVARQKPTTAWSVDLPATPDYRDHRTFVTPPFTKPGLYVIVASGRADFAETRNRRAAVDIVIGDLVLLTQRRQEGLDVRVVAGGSGRPVHGAAVEVWRFDWNQGHHREQRLIADQRGRVMMRWNGNERDGRPRFLVTRHGGDVGIEPDHLYGWRTPAEDTRRDTLLYTDRSVYRPGQQVRWKAVAYEGKGSRFRVAPDVALTVDLLDANGQVVTSRAVTTNRFGSASGAFEVPTGRLLGAWRLRSSRGGMTQLRIEEYKRPTFEVALEEPAEALRLNRPARLPGEARYYFGLPVTGATVAWTVSRQPVYPHWWGWWFGGSVTQPQVIAAGKAMVDGEGRFEIAFTPEADEREQPSAGISYRFRVSADVTDEGGETRSAERSLRLGFVAVEGRIEPEATFFRGGKPAKVTLHRTDLDGTPRAGEASWRLLRVEQPPATLLPADQPLPVDPRRRDAYRTPGDLLRPRWETDYPPDAILREWPDGSEVGRGTVRHGDKGLAEATLPGVPAGVYRLRYSTRDPFGATYETSRELIVVEPGATPLQLPALLLVEKPAVPAGGTARLLVHSGLPAQQLVVEIQRRDGSIEERVVESSQGAQVLEIPIGEAERGGLAVGVRGVRDHQLMQQTAVVLVPWDDKKLKVEFAIFRDKVRPRTRETWRVTVRGTDEKALAEGAAELLAYMYDRSLDLFAAHQPADPLRVYPGPPGMPAVGSSLGDGGETWVDGSLAELPEVPVLTGDALRFLEAYGIGGPGVRRALGSLGYARGGAEMNAVAVPQSMPPPAPAPVPEVVADLAAAKASPADGRLATGAVVRSEGEAAAASRELRSEFAETAFWHPHLVTGADGSASFEFTVPDSVTEWNLWVHALTEDLRAGSSERQVRTVKELMVRPYLPRFFREGDEATLQVVVNDAGEKPFQGTLRFEILDPATGASLAPAFGLPAARTQVPFSVQPGGGVTLSFPVKAPPRIGTVSFRVTATAGDWSDGELRQVPVLPGRMHLAQSRFATLRDRDRRVLRFPDMAAGDDPTLLHDQLVVTVDAQLFNTVLSALPYLAQYPYECTEQTLNRFLSAGIVSRVFADHPSLAQLGRELAAQRDTPLEPWALDDPNRRMALEETPWLVTARGGDAGGLPLLKILDPDVARAQRDSAIAKLQKAQTSLGAFPWFPGGPPSPYMTLYILAGLSRAREAGVEVPRQMVVQAWSYMHRHYLDEMVREMRRDDCCWETVTLLGFVLSNYEDRGGGEWTGGVFSKAERREMLDFSFKHWKQHSPLLKSMLALTLHRAGRGGDAKLVFDSVMDSAKTTADEGTFWAPEDRAWLWYNDTIETHAFALRTLSELQPKDARRHGLVQWLLLNKKLNHWSSTRGTAEVIYALVAYLESEGALGKEEAVRVRVAGKERLFRFLPDRVGALVEDDGEAPAGGTAPRSAPGPAAPTRSNQLVIPGPEIDPRTMAEVVVEKETKGFAFASATWHFSTERLPKEGRGDLFAVERAFFRRLQEGGKWKLVPLAEGTRLQPGDQLEVHLSIKSRAAAEYVHLRDPRPAGSEPESVRSGWKWEILPVYEEVRDSGANFFFEWLPAGEYTFKHRLRVNMAGTFRVSPAELQSMYAPEFNAYSAGQVVKVAPAQRAAGGANGGAGVRRRPGR
jgi:uncharacterized protein YfaS (alpha-2-macroglobulin family)